MKKLAFLASPLLLAVLALSSLAMAQHKMQSADRDDQSKLVQIVRDATQQYVDVNNAVAAGYSPLFGCVSGSDHGAMGIHYINPNLLNGTVDAKHPPALIYEPSDGRLRLVGVEFIVDAATWQKSNSGPPVLEGQVFLFVDSPNRYTVPSFFELHVWAWRDNPQGAFVDWNDRVSCGHQ